MPRLRRLPASFFPTDPDENAASLANHAELLLACLDAVGAQRVVEVGAFHGKSTNAVLEWAEGAGATLVAIDPAPQPDLREIASKGGQLELIEATSHDALPDVGEADVIIVDGDHNYFTVSEELRLIEQAQPGDRMPLIVCHDIGWPLARRDAYYVPERIPAEHRQPLAHDTYLVVGDPGVVDAGMPFACVAEREGGERNGILTAIEDFLADRRELRFAKVAPFFGLGFIWHPGASWAQAVDKVLEPWDRNPMLERLESNRVLHMTERYRMTRLLELEVERSEQSDEVLRSLLGSRAFAAGEQLSRLHGRGQPAFTRDAVARALEEPGGSPLRRQP